MYISVYTELKNRYTYSILKHIRRELSLNLNTTYHMPFIQNYILQVPINANDIDEKKLIPIDLIKKRTDEIIKFLKTNNFEDVGYELRSLHMENVNLSELIKISYDYDGEEYNEFIKLGVNLPNFPCVEEILNENNIKIINYIDPCLKNFGVFVNLSKTYDKMNVGWNYLHYFEHVMTYGVRDIPNVKIIDMNGGTVMNGLCYVYAIVSTVEDAKIVLDNYIKFHLECRTLNKWESIKDKLKLEKQRTYSETSDWKALNDMGKSDTTATHKGYNIDILHSFACDEFEIMITTNKKITEQIIIPSIKRDEPKELQKMTLNYFPMHSIYNKQYRDYYVLKYDKSENDIMKNKNNRYFYGLDNIVYSVKEDLSMLNTPLNKLFILGEKRNEYLKNNVFPYYSHDFTEYAEKKRKARKN